MHLPPIPEAALRRRISINVRARRALECLTVKRAAMLARIPTGTWKKVEAGEITPSPWTLERVAEALDTTTEKLLRAPYRNCAAATAAKIEGFQMSEMVPDEMVAELIEPLMVLAARAGIPCEKVAEVATELDIDPLDLLLQISPSRTSTTRH